MVALAAELVSYLMKYKISEIVDEGSGLKPPKRSIF